MKHGFAEILANCLIAFQHKSELAGWCKTTSFLVWRWSGNTAGSAYSAGAAVAGFIDTGDEMLGCMPTEGAGWHNGPVAVSEAKRQLASLPQARAMNMSFKLTESPSSIGEVRVCPSVYVAPSA